jgi:hypothetical protein
VVKLPYDHTQEQVLSDGSKGGLKVGAVLMLPEGFKIALKSAFPQNSRRKSRTSIISPTATPKKT